MPLRNAYVPLPRNQDELLRVFNPLADLTFVVRENGSHRMLQLETRHFCGADYLYQTCVSRQQDMWQLVVDFDFSVLSPRPFTERGMLHYDRQTETLYHFENEHTDIWGENKFGLPHIVTLMQIIAQDYRIVPPKLVIDPNAQDHEYDPTDHAVRIVPDENYVQGLRGSEICSAEIVVHEMAHAILRDYDQHKSCHHPYFAKLVIDMYANYLGYDAHELYDHARKLGVFGPLDPHDPDHFQALPKPVTFIGDRPEPYPDIEVFHLPRNADKAAPTCANG
jgi:hypothetical protein